MSTLWNGKNIMGQNKNINRSIVLASRPKGAPTKNNFRLGEVSTPVPGEGGNYMPVLNFSERVLFEK
jgi:NADPH-dependent curcumin reductase CurA